VVPASWCGAVPSNIDDPSAAALPNPALSSWLPLVYRAQLQAGESVLVLGATGVAGKLAIQIAKYLGAERVVAAGRNEQVLKTLPDLGADSIIPLDQPDQSLRESFAAEAAADPINIVLDYVWGHPAEVLISALMRHDILAEEGRIRFISIGSLAGATAAVPSAVLRSSGLEIYGSGGGSVSHQAIAETFPKLWEAVSQSRLKIDTEAVPLSKVEEVWNVPEVNGRRRVFVV
jgi:NADPH:quinone reductase-like Zn-dependent oxidoreductase